MKTIRCKYLSSGFSLIELVVVIAILVIMMSLLIPAIGGFSSTFGRRGAVNILMNTFEQARVAALESGQTVYVGFANDQLPSSKQDMYYSSFIVFRDATDEERDPNGDGNTSDGQFYTVIKKWTPLPKNISFKRVNNSLVPLTGGNLSINYTNLNKALPASFQLSGDIPGIAFNSAGTIEGGSNPLQLFLYEGYFLNNQDNFTRNNAVQQSAAGLFEKITFSRYTGRAQLDITTLQ